MDEATQAAYSGRWDEALSLLKSDGDAKARSQLDALAGRHPGALLEPPPRQRLSEVSAVSACYGFMPEGFAPHFIAKAEGRLKRALVYSADGFEQEDTRRTATVFQVNAAERDVLTAIMMERAARLSGLPIDAHEPPNVISYEPGQKYDVHVDFIDPDLPLFRRELAVLGQRVMTIVTYLNTDFDGAETTFPVLGVTWKAAKPGDAMAWSNVLSNRTPDRNTQHAGLPPTRGRKWVLSQWLRNRPQPQV